MIFKIIILLVACNVALANDQLLEESSPVESYVGIAQQGIGLEAHFVTCDVYLKDCPSRTVKHRVSLNNLGKNQTEPFPKTHGFDIHKSIQKN